MFGPASRIKLRKLNLFLIIPLNVSIGTFVILRVKYFIMVNINISYTLPKAHSITKTCVGLDELNEGKNEWMAG